MHVFFPQTVSSPPPAQPTFGASPPFAPRPQPSAFSSTPILNQQIQEDEPEVIRYVPSQTFFYVYGNMLNHAFWDRAWREKQAEEIKQRDEASKAKRQEIISKAEAAIDQFYEDYAAKKERSIRENKYIFFVVSPNGLLMMCQMSIGTRRRITSRIFSRRSQRGLLGSESATPSNSRTRKAKLLLGRVLAPPISLGSRRCC